MVIKAFEATNWQKYPVNAFQHWPRNTQFNGRSLSFSVSIISFLIFFVFAVFVLAERVPMIDQEL
jgi:hypothetical protein